MTQIRRLSITTTLTLVFVLFGTVLVIIMGGLSYVSGQQALREAVTSELDSIALEKEAALHTWLEDQQRDIAALTGSHDISVLVTELVSARSSMSVADGQSVYNHLIEDMRSWLRSHEFEALLVIEAEEGRVIAATDPAEEGRFKENRPYYIQGREGVYISAPYYSLALQKPAMTVSAPLYGMDGRLVAVLAGRLNMKELSQIIQRRASQHQTNDAYLVNSANLFVTQPRFISDPAVLQQGVRTEMVKTCLTGNSGVFSTNDYRDVPVIAVYRWLSDRQLCLIVKLDQAEALAPIQALGRTVAVVSGLALLTATLLAIALARTITRPVLALQQGVIRFGAGALNEPLPETPHNELGRLAREFNHMAAALSQKEKQLRGYAGELEGRVAERTAALQASEAKYRQLAETARDIILTHDLEGRLLYCNRAGFELSGYSEEEFLQLNVTDLVARDQQDTLTERRHGRKRRDKSVYRYETVMVTKHGQFVPVEVVSSMLGSQDQVPSILIIARDITERKQAEESLIQHAEKLARSNSELERFAYIASHDLQEPLRMVSSYLQLIERRYRERLDETGNEFINYAVSGANRMKALINDLLAYSRIDRSGNTLTPINCKAILNQTLDNLEVGIQENKASISYDTLPTVMANEVQLRQLFQNLINNALKFRREVPPRIHIRAEMKQDQWVFSVEDNGIGIEPEYAERIFIVFQRLHGPTRYPGTGIGLAICKKIVEQHGGRIWFESEVGQGTTFYFTIPDAIISD